MFRHTSRALAKTSRPRPPDAPAVFTNYGAAVEWLLATDAGDLTVREIDFLESMRGILRRFEPRPKQAAWIRGLVERLGASFDG